MKAPALLLALGTLLGVAHAQMAPPAAMPKAASAEAKTARPAERRAATYDGPKAVKDNKELGRKMMEKSKPTDGPVRASQIK